MEPRRWPTLWVWIGYYLKLVLGHAPTEKEAAKTAQISDEKLRNNKRKTGVRFLKPLQKFYEMRPMPEFLVRFMEEMEKYFPKLPEPPPPSAPRPRRPEPTTVV